MFYFCTLLVKLKISNYLPPVENDRTKYSNLYYLDPNFSEGSAILDVSFFLFLNQQLRLVIDISIGWNEFFNFHITKLL